MLSREMFGSWWFIPRQHPRDGAIRCVIYMGSWILLNLMASGCVYLTGFLIFDAETYRRLGMLFALAYAVPVLAGALPVVLGGMGEAVYLSLPREDRKRVSAWQARTFALGAGVELALLVIFALSFPVGGHFWFREFLVDVLPWIAVVVTAWAIPRGSTYAASLAGKTPRAKNLPIFDVLTLAAAVAAALVTHHLIIPVR